MPPKQRKSITPWFKCEACDSIVTSKDLQLHEDKSCPPADGWWPHGFIRNKILHGCLEQLKANDIVKHVPSEERHNIILLSQSALQICEMCIGDPVVVTFGSDTHIFKAWPTLEKTLTSVTMSKEAIEQISKMAGDLVVVNKLESPPEPAQEVFISSMQDLDLPSDLTQMLTRLYRGRILCVGNYLYVPFYGKKLKFKINIFNSAIAAGNNVVDNLVQSLDKIEISPGIKFYKVFDSTKWSLSRSDEKERKQEKVDLLERIGGLKQVIGELQELMDLALGVTAPIPGLKETRAILLHGISGTGKTLLAKALAANSGVNVVVVNGPEIYSKFFGETEAKLKDMFTKAKQNAPSILLLDDLDSMCPRRNASSSEQEKRVVATLLTQLDGLHVPLRPGTRPPAVLVMATSRQLDALDPALRRPGRLDREVEISIPGPEARCEILDKMLAGIPHDLSAEAVQQVASAAHGFVGADLAALCSRAGAVTSQRGAVNMTASDLRQALASVKPSAMREVQVEVPSVRWTDIGGQRGLKLKLAQAVEWPLAHPDAFQRLGISPPRGLLMFGPPGCSKTMIAKALATESKLNFLSIKGPELFSKWVGESERAVREVFRRARQVAPSVVFFDELDALAGERSAGGAGGGGGTNVAERVLAQLLTELDGVEPLGNVLVLGATNRPDRIDKALLRPGRLDRVVYVPLPDTETRADILAIQLRKTPVDADVCVAEIADRTEGYSGAEVLAVCHEAALAALEEDIDAGKVMRRHFLAALESVTPRTPASLLQLYQNYLQQ